MFGLSLWSSVYFFAGKPVRVPPSEVIVVGMAVDTAGGAASRALIVNVPSLEIKRSEGYGVLFNVWRIKHHMQESCDTLFATLDSFEGARSFGVECQVLAADIPHKITGQLHVIIEKD